MVKYYKDDLSHLFFALADRNRREILHMVVQEPRKASELAKRFDISFPAVSKHIRILENSGFIRRTIIGREHHITAERKSVDKALEWIAHYRKFWEEGLERLEIYLKEKGEKT